ncbi:MAG: ABC transporter ATP-binding protein [Acidimicrobiales bacterium]
MTTAPVPAGSAPAGPGAATGSALAPALELVHVSAAYGPYRALFDVTFAVPAGSVVALLGPNGAGKSTVARVVSGLLPTTEGTVRVDGREVTGKPAYRVARAGLAHVPEGGGVFANLSVEENLVVSFRRRAGAAAVRGALARAYESFPILGERRRQRAGTLSGGQQRLLSLAKVLVVPPKLLVADELSLGLAPGVVDAVYDGLRQIHAAGAALLVVEQHVDRVLQLAERAVVLQRGTVAFEGDAADALPAIEQVLAEGGDAGGDSGGVVGPDGAHEVHGAGAAGAGSGTDAATGARPGEVGEPDWGTGQR